MSVLDAAKDFATLEAEHESLLEFLYQCPVGIVQTGLDGAVRMMNPYATQILIAILGAPVIENLFAALRGCAPELDHMARRFTEERGHICQGHRIFVRATGPGPKTLSCTLLKTGDDRLVAVLQDISREVEQERQLRQNETLFSALMTGINDFALFSLDARGCISTWNSSSVRLTGYAAAEMLGRELDVMYHRDTLNHEHVADQLLVAAREGWSLREARCARRDGASYWSQVLIAATEEQSGGIEGYSVVMRDVTERRVTGEELRRLLTTDHLTGATNRGRFFELAGTEFSRCQRMIGRPLGAIMMDVDHFKRVNDAFGHAAGDEVLRALVRCCQPCLREGDVLGRLGGEEFGVLLPGTDLAGAALVAERMRVAAAEALATVGGHAIGATISLGCAEFRGRDSFDAMLRAADEALYAAKRGGRNRVMVADAAAPEAAKSASTV